MTPERRTRMVFAGGVAALAVVFLALHVVRLVEPFGMDQGCFACFARWIPRGWLPYRDLFDSKAPLFVYTWTLTAAIPGDIERAAWWFELAWLGATMIAAGALSARMWGRAAGLATAALLFVGTWSPAWGGFWARGQSEELLALPMIGAAWLAWRARERTMLALWAGVLTGICGMYKIPSLAIAVAWSVAWLATLPTRDALARVGLAAAGVAAPIALAAGWFAAHHALSDFIQAVLVYQSAHARYIAPAWGDVLQDFARTMALQGTLLVAAAAVGVVHLARRGSPALHWLGPWIVMTMAAVVVQRQLASYHYLMTVPALAVAGGHGVSEIARALRETGDRWPVAALGVVALAGLGAREALVWRDAYGPDLDCLRGRLPRDEYLRRIQRGAFSTATEEEAARYVHDHTTPDQGVLVWGLSPGVYSLSDRHPTTRYVFHKLLVTDAPVSRMWAGLDRRRIDFMDKLRSDPPTYVLVGRGDANGFEPLDSYTSLQRFRDLRDFVARDYDVETQIGRFLVYRRR